MHHPLIPNKRFSGAKIGPFNHTASVSFGEDTMKEALRGKVQINTNQAVRLVNDKHELLNVLEVKKIPCVKPHHRAGDFMVPYQGPQLSPKFDYERYDNTFGSNLVYARSPKGSYALETISDVTNFIKAEGDLDGFTFYSVDMEEFRTASIAVCPLFGTEKVRITKDLVIEASVIHADFSGPAPVFVKQMYKLAVKVAQEIGADYAVVEFMFDEESAIVHNVTMAPCECMNEELIARMIAEKALKGSGYRHKERGGNKNRLARKW